MNFDNDINTHIPMSTAGSYCGTVLPLTREAFEEIVETVTKKFRLPFDDNMRVMAISFFHSLDRKVFIFDEEELGAYLHKAMSNDLTFHIGQEIHLKRQAEAAEKKKAEEETPKLSVVEPAPNH